LLVLETHKTSGGDRNKNKLATFVVAGMVLVMLVAEMMVEHDCGEIPVVENLGNMLPVGVITDRDITCRTVARGLNPLIMTVADCMTTTPVTVMPGMSFEECCRVLEENLIRRVPVVDASGACIGIVAQADIARHASNVTRAKSSAKCQNRAARLRGRLKAAICLSEALRAERSVEHDGAPRTGIEKELR
jgi:signal-transduction protein with cAMP-binding, CBS, and nucleotidyltransferase domain